MKKILLLMLTLVMSVTTWAAEPYFEVVSGSYESGNVTVKITFPDATTVEIPDDGFASLWNSGNDDFQAYTWKQYGGDITSQGNTLNVVFENFTPQDDENAYYIYAPRILVDGVAFGYTQIYDKKMINSAEVVDGSLTSGSMTVKVTFPKSTSIETGLGSSWTISLWNNGSQLDYKSKDSDVTVNGKSISMTFNFDPQSSDDLANCTLNIARMAIKIDGSWNSSAISFPVTANNGGDEPGDEPGGDDPEDPADLTNYFWIENAVADATWVHVDSNIANLEYTATPTNAKSWTLIDDNNNFIPYNNLGDKVYFRAAEQGNTTMQNVFDYDYSGVGLFNVGGDITTLLDREGNVEELTEENVFNGIFHNYIKDASELVLPSTTLSPYCYSSMFFECTELEVAPALPATILEEGCYSMMFYGCSSLVTAPELPATDLVNGCYTSMFNGCTNLNYVKAAFVAWNVQGYGSYNSTDSWLNGVASTGTLDLLTQANNELSYSGWYRNGNNCPSDWNVRVFLPVKVSSVGYSTIYNTQNWVVPEGVEAYVAYMDYENTFHFEKKYEANEVVPGGVAFVLKAAPGNYSFYETSEPSADKGYYQNDLLGSEYDSWSNMFDYDESQYYYYALSLDENGENVGFYWMMDGGAPFYSLANKAWLHIEKSRFQNGAKVAFVFGESETDAIDAVVAPSRNVDGIYDLSGRRVNNTNAKGIYIINGKKVVK